MNRPEQTFSLIMSCVSGDIVHVTVCRREDIIGWLKKLDHEGATWDVYQSRHGSTAIDAHNITKEVEFDYASAR